MRWTRNLGGLMAAGLLAAGCDNVGDDRSVPTEPAPSATATAPEATPTVTEAPTTTPTPPANDLTRCQAENLSLQALAAGGAAGTHFSALALTNEGQDPCSLTGFPGVSLVDGSGDILGEPAARNEAVPVERILLGPGQSAHATIALPNYQNFPSGRCEGPSASLVLYPPDSTQSLTVAFEDYVCPGFSVQAFERGENERGRG